MLVMVGENIRNLGKFGNFQIYIKFQGTFGSHVGLIGGHFE